MKTFEITLASANKVTAMLRTFEAVVNCQNITPSTPLEELGFTLGNLSNEGDQINDVSATDSVVHVDL